MIELVIYYVHVVALAVMFTRYWQEEGASGGFMAVFFMALIFFVGWSITTFLLKLTMEKEGLGEFFTRDAASLLLLTVGETILYYFYLRDDKWKKKSGNTDEAVTEN
jgi:hypothetical protein